MTDGVRYMEIDWKSVCCPLTPGNFPIIGFGGSEGNVCTGEGVAYYMDTEVLEIGTKIYLADQSTPLGTDLFRVDGSGAVYVITDGVVTSTTELSCSFSYQVSNALIGPDLITAITVDDVPLIYLGGVDFPLAAGDTGQFTSNVFTPGLRTVKVTITGDVGAATLVSVFDSAVTLHTQAFTGNGTYTFPNVFVSGPNVDTFGPGISLE